eukprot:scaffold96117_cov22-Cyclotella_meneghiniana.AAC.1
MGFREFVFKLATECFQLSRSRPSYPDPDSTLCSSSEDDHDIIQHYSWQLWLLVCMGAMQLPILAHLVGIWLKPVVCWTEVPLSTLLVQRRSSPIASVPCLYGGRWHLPHRRRRHRGESSIRMPCIYTLPSPPSCRALFLLVLLSFWCASLVQYLVVLAQLGRGSVRISRFGLRSVCFFQPAQARGGVTGPFHRLKSSLFIDDSSDPVLDELTDSLDDLFFGRLDLEQSLFDLCKAGYHFTFGWTVTEEVSWGNWRHRRTIKRRFEKLESRANLPSVPPPSTAPSSSTASHLAQFVKSFNPAAAARAAFSHLMYSVVPHNITGRFDLKYSKTRPMLRAALFACAFNVKLPDNCPIIFDSGASVNVTPFIEDFVPNTYRPCDISVKGLTVMK